MYWFFRIRVNPMFLKIPDSILGFQTDIQLRNFAK